MIGPYEQYVRKKFKEANKELQKAWGISDEQLFKWADYCIKRARAIDQLKMTDRLDYYPWLHKLSFSLWLLFNMAVTPTGLVIYYSPPGTHHYPFAPRYSHKDILSWHWYHFRKRKIYQIKESWEDLKFWLHSIKFSVGYNWHWFRMRKLYWTYLEYWRYGYRYHDGRTRKS